SFIGAPKWRGRPRAEPQASGAECPMPRATLSSGLERSDKNKRPGSGVNRVSNSLSTGTCTSCRLRCLLLGYAFCLWAFLPLDNFELDIVALLEALISLRLDGTVVDEHIRPVIAADETEALCVVEPFHFAFNS